MIKVNRGDTAVITVNLFIDNAPYSPAEGEHVVFSVKKKIDDNEPIVLKKDVVNNEIRLEHADTCGLECGTYYCDVRIYTDDKSKVYTPIVDELRVCEVVNCDLS